MDYVRTRDPRDATLERSSVGPATYPRQVLRGLVRRPLPCLRHCRCLLPTFLCSSSSPTTICGVDDDDDELYPAPLLAPSQPSAPLAPTLPLPPPSLPLFFLFSGNGVRRRLRRRAMSSSASGSQKAPQKAWPRYGEVPLTRCPECRRPDPLKRLTCVRSQSGNVGQEFVKCESKPWKEKDGKVGICLDLA